jgi:hypothetical protein
MRNYHIREKLGVLQCSQSSYIDPSWVLYYPPRFTEYYPAILISMFSNRINPVDVWDRLFTWRNARTSRGT